MDTQTELDWCKARDRRDQGINVAIFNAEAHDPEWPQKAFDMLLLYLETHEGEFQTEDVRVYAEARGLKKPEHNRAWGAVTLRAARLGWIKKAGIAATNSPTAHMANATVWKRKQNA